MFEFIISHLDIVLWVAYVDDRGCIAVVNHNQKTSYYVLLQYANHNDNSV